MKKHSSHFFTSLNKEDMAKLTVEVKETIAFDLVAPLRKVFTSADLLDIRRQRKAGAEKTYLKIFLR